MNSTEKNKEKISKYEFARLIGSRALQISNGAPFALKLSDADLAKIGYNPIEIAKKEFEAGVLPIVVFKKPVVNAAAKA